MKSAEEYAHKAENEHDPLWAVAYAVLTLAATQMPEVSIREEVPSEKQ